jgi:Dynamin central region/Dynamin GTPase effector domain
MLTSVRSALARLPDSFADNPQAHLLELCNRFLNDVTEYTSGNPNHDPDKTTFLQDVIGYYDELKGNMEKTRPQFDIEELHSPPSTSPRKIGLKEVTDVITKMSYRELYGIIPFRVHEHFIKAFLRDWEKICLHSFIQIEESLREEMLKLCEKHFDRFKSSNLLNAAMYTPFLRTNISSAVSEILHETAHMTRKTIHQYCRMEKHRPFTMSKDEYSEAKEQEITEFALQRHGNQDIPLMNGQTFALADIYGTSRTFSATEDNLLTILAVYGIHLNSPQDLIRVHHDTKQVELDVIAHVSAYFDLSSKRLIDDIPKIFETIFAEDSGIRLGKELCTKLGLVGEKGFSTCERYAKDDPETHAKRADLGRKKTILEAALATIVAAFK